MSQFRAMPSPRVIFAHGSEIGAMLQSLVNAAPSVLKRQKNAKIGIRLEG